MVRNPLGQYPRRPARLTRSRERGLTLLELIIYIGASALVLLGLLSLLSLLVNTWGRGQARATVEEQMRGAVERMRYDVENAQGVLSPQYAQAVLTDGPVGYWRLGESSGTAAADSSINTNTGTYTGGYTLGASTELSSGDTAATFNGTSGYVSIPDSNSLDVGDVFTYEFWANHNITSGTYAVFEKGINSPKIYIYGAGGLALDLSGTATVVQTISGKGSSIGAWHHYAITKNGSTVKVYIDGSDVTGTVTNQTFASNSTAQQIGRTSSGTQYFPGSLDEAAIYNVALSVGAIKAHYEEGVGNSLVLDGGGKTTRTYSGYAWSEYFGWLSFNCLGQTDPWDCAQSDSTFNNYAVTGTLNTVSGFAMTQNTGFLSFTCDTSPLGDPCKVADYHVTIDSNGQYHGWAWGELLGWISFNCADRSICATSNYKVYEAPTGGGWELRGWAWSENYGWISLNCTDRSICGTSSYKVTATLAGSNINYTVNAGVLSGTLSGGSPSNLTDAAVTLAPCTGHLGYFITVANPAPARPTVLACFKATYSGKASSVLKYSTEYQTTFQLQ